MARRANTIEDIEAQIAKLTEKKRKIMDRRRIDFGRVAEKAGLLELDIPEDDLQKELTALAAKFQAASKNPDRRPAEPAQSPTG